MKRRQNFDAKPNGRQCKQLARLFGDVRVVRNRFIDTMESAYERGEPISLNTAEKESTTILKRTEGYEYLNEVSSIPLQQAARNTARSYREFFNARQSKRSEVGHPKYASRKDRQSASFTKNAFKIRCPQGCKWVFIKLSKIDGELKIKACREIDWDSVGTVTVIRHPSGRYEVSVTHDIEVTVQPETLKACGVDLGLTSLAAITYSDGTREIVDNPRYYRNTQRKLRKAQKALSRKTKGSKNREKAARKVAALHEKIARKRKDHLHKLSRRLVDENQVIGLEDLSVSALARNSHLSKSVYDAGWGMFRDMVTYKAEDSNRELVIADRSYPSTQLCSVCGHRGGKKPLNVRKWVCGHCQTVLDRDFNAATNLMLHACEAAGHADSVNACGGTVKRQQLAGVGTVESGTHRGDREGFSRRGRNPRPLGRGGCQGNAPRR